MYKVKIEFKICKRSLKRHQCYGMEVTAAASLGGKKRREESTTALCLFTVYW